MDCQLETELLTCTLTIFFAQAMSAEVTSELLQTYIFHQGLLGLNEKLCMKPHYRNLALCFLNFVRVGAVMIWDL